MNSKNQCANGRIGYDIETGKPYTPKPSCPREHAPGHTLCDPCRVEAGGYDRQSCLKT